MHLTPLEDPEADRLRSEIGRDRPYPHLLVEFARADEDDFVAFDRSERIAASLLRHQGLIELPPSQLCELEIRDARGLGSRLLHRGLAYNVAFRELEEAEMLADRFLSLVNRCGEWLPRAFTNARAPVHMEEERWGSYSWFPATDATFDLGLVVVAQPVVGMIWSRDED